MPNRKSSINQGIQARNVHAQAIAIGKGAQAIANQNKSSEEISQAFLLLSQKVASLPDGSEKIVAQSAVTALEAEAKLGEKAKEEDVSKWFGVLAQMAPDIWDVAVATFANPIAGLGIAFKKVADHARAEKDKKNG